MSMQVRYLKRLRLEVDLRHVVLPEATLPDGYRWREWQPQLIAAHAAAKWASFSQEVDSRVFLALSTLPGCDDLMRSIALHPGFLPETTWLVEFVGNEFHAPVPCGTVQGLSHSPRLGSIQNLGVSPDHRGQGLGRALLLQALRGFQQSRLQRVYLDVTAVNHRALGLYRALGFRQLSTRYLELPGEVEADATGHTAGLGLR